MSEPTKETIYIDAEDEITAIIEKVRSSRAKVVALVLPKRSATMQSVVNLKLLQKTTKDAKKNVVLVTSDPKLLPIAGAVGMFVARTPQSKPEIPAPPKAATQAEEPVEEAEPTVEAAAAGAVAGAAAASRASKKRAEASSSSSSGGGSGSSSSSADMPEAEDTIDLDNDKSTKSDGAAAKGAKSKKDKNKKIKVPNFDRFRIMLFAGIAAVILLLVGGYFAMFVLPKAKVTLKTDTTVVNTDLTLTASTTAQSVDVEKNIIPASNKELKKTDSEKAPATGEKNLGEKATGSIKLRATKCGGNPFTTPADVPSGTGISANGVTFIAQANTSFKGSGTDSNGCYIYDGTNTTSVVAPQTGAKYNIDQGTFTVAGRSDVSGSGSTSGGSDKVVKVVSQQDVDTAKQKALDRMTTAATDELKKQFNDAGMIPLSDTFSAGDPTVVSSPNVGSEANEVSVNVTVTFSELGVKSDDLKQIVEANAKKDIDESKQAIQDNGISKAVIRTTENKTKDGVKIQVQTLVVAGPQLDADAIKQEIAGKKKGDTQKILLARPGIKDVDVSYSPFWVGSTPKNTKHITIIFEQANGN